MGYTKEAFTETSAVPAAAPAVMREPVSIDPYAHMARVPKPSVSGQTATTEAPVTPPPSVALSPQVAALARKEQKFRQDQDKFKADQAALAAEKAELAALKELKTKLDAGDYSGLDGQIDYEKYTAHKLAQLNASDPEAQRLAALEAKIDGIAEANKTHIDRQFEAAVKERKVAADELIKSDPKLTEFRTRAEKILPPEVKLQDVVTQHILDTWENDSEELSVKQATQEVQEAIVEKAKAWASVLETPEPIQAEKKQLPPLKPGLKTITNQVTAGELKPMAKSYQGMSDADRWAEARKRAEAKLNQQRG